MKRLQIQIFAAVAAIVGLLLSLLSGAGNNATVALRVYSIATSASVFLFLFYEHVVWHWPIVRKINKKPDLRGTWMGTLVSSFQRDGKPIPPTPSIIRVRQTASTQSLTFFSGESSSVTEQSTMMQQADGRWVATWTYSNTPRSSVRHRSDCHFGTAEVAFDPIEGLTGAYYTDRLTRGELHFSMHSKKLFSSVAAAQAHSDQFTELPLS